MPFQIPGEDRETRIGNAVILILGAVISATMVFAVFKAPLQFVAWVVLLWVATALSFLLLAFTYRMMASNGHGVLSQTKGAG